MKKGKRNLIIVAVLLFVCAAVWLNWSYNNSMGPDPVNADMVMAEDAAKEEADAAYGASLNGEEADEVLSALAGKEQDALETSGGYFATARLTRQQSRDSALGLLEQAAASENASQEVIDSAMSEIAAMASFSMQEAQMENLLIAKGFTDCVVFMSAEDITVAVPAPLEGLSQADVARITETVITESGMPASALRVIEVKGTAMSEQTAPEAE